MRQDLVSKKSSRSPNATTIGKGKTKGDHRCLEQRRPPKEEHAGAPDLKDSARARRRGGGAKVTQETRRRIQEARRNREPRANDRRREPSTSTSICAHRSEDEKPPSLKSEGLFDVAQVPKASYSTKITRRPATVNVTGNSR